MLRFGKRHALVLAIFCAGAVARPAAAQGLPKGEEILEKYIAATGGKAAYEKCKNRIAKGTLDIASAGIQGPMTIYAAAPNKMYMEAELGGIGKIEDGTDGQVAWSISAVQGPRLKKGAEKVSTLRNADFYGVINWRKRFKKVECVGEQSIDGKPCYKLELTTPEGQLHTHYYDKSSNLLLKSTTTQETQNGKLPVESSFSDFKKVDDLLMPFKTKQKVLGQEVVIALEKVEQNVKLPENRFDLPDEIKKLVEKEKKESGSPKK
jgi:hypothetical protein